MRAKVQKILTWRWKKFEPEEDENETSNEETTGETATEQPKPVRRPPPLVREFFVKYQHLSYWHCEWVDELRLDVFQPSMFRIYCRKTDMEEPPVIDMETFESKKRIQLKKDKDLEDLEINAGTGRKRPEKKRSLHSNTDLEEKFYRYGIRAEWLQIQRIINHKQSRNGRYMYLIKWADLAYDQCSWEYEDDDEIDEIPDLKQAITNYWKLRNAAEAVHHSTSKSKSSKSKSSKSKSRSSKSSLDDSEWTGFPDRPTTDLRKKYEKQPDFIDVTGMELHPYQLEGINWLRFSFANGTHTILADEMGLGKTIQTVTFLYSLFKEGHCKGPFLVAAPLSTIINWEREFEVNI